MSRINGLCDFITVYFACIISVHISTPSLVLSARISQREMIVSQKHDAWVKLPQGKKLQGLPGRDLPETFAEKIEKVSSRGKRDQGHDFIIQRTASKDPEDDVEYSAPLDSPLRNPVVIEEWRTDASMDHKRFAVDDTISALLVDVHSSKNSPRVTIYDPKGSEVREDGENTTMKYTDNGQRRSMIIKHPTPGSWKLTFPDRHRYNITVKGSSVLQFKSNFIDSRGFEMSGNPVTGTNMTLAINVLGMEYLKSLTDVFMTSQSGRTIFAKKLSGPIGRQHNSYKIVVRIPSEEFKIGVHGIDKHFHPVSRLHTDIITPDGIRLKLKNLSPGPMVAGGVYVVGYTLVNDGTDSKFRIDVISDSKEFHYYVFPNYQIIPAREQRSGNITIHVSPRATTGTTSNMVVIVTSDLGETQYTSRDFVVKEKRKKGDTHPPEFYQTNVIDNCHRNESCEEDTWDVIFQVEDDESGLRRVDVDDHTVSSVTMETFNDGVVNTFVNGTISTNCCRKQVTVIVEDVQGNQGRIPIVYPEYSVQNKTIDSGSQEPLSSLQIGAVVVGSLTGCLVLVIIITLIVQYVHVFRNITGHKKSKKRKTTRKKLIPTISGNKVI